VPVSLVALLLKNEVAVCYSAHLHCREENAVLQVPRTSLCAINTESMMFSLLLIIKMNEHKCLFKT
jgi:hypothetical protein